MKSMVYIGVVIFASLAWTTLDSNAVQQQKEDAYADTTKRKAVTTIPKYAPMAGCTQGSASLPKQSIVDLMSKQVCVMDLNSQKQFKVVSYDFIYAERGVFEDSLGIPTIMTEYHYEECRGDTIKTRWQRVLADRLYKGDTVKITQVVFTVDGKNIKIKEPLFLVAQ
jgi:hypothetical protein